MLSWKCAHEMATSRGSRPTQMYVTAGFVAQPVERRMGLDEASMLLGFEVGNHVADVTGLHIEPRRDEIE